MNDISDRATKLFGDPGKLIGEPFPATYKGWLEEYQWLLVTLKSTLEQGRTEQAMWMIDSQRDRFSQGESKLKVEKSLYEMNLSELRALQGQLLNHIQHKICGDPRTRITVPITGSYFGSTVR